MKIQLAIQVAGGQARRDRPGIETVIEDARMAEDLGFGVVYTPWFWRWIMAIIRLVPERIFVRMKF